MQTPVGDMAGPVTLAIGTGVQQASFHRQGDYGSMRVDPQHGCTLWYTQEYYLISRPFHWSTPTSGFYINDTERLHVQTPMSFAPCRLTKTL
jgi:hypothetical protein